MRELQTARGEPFVLLSMFREKTRKQCCRRTSAKAVAGTEQHREHRSDLSQAPSDPVVADGRTRLTIRSEPGKGATGGQTSSSQAFVRVHTAWGWSFHNERFRPPHSAVDTAPSAATAAAVCICPTAPVLPGHQACDCHVLATLASPSHIGHRTVVVGQKPCCVGCLSD